MHKVQI